MPPTQTKESESTHFFPLALRIWFFTQIFLLTFDASFVLSRPHSFEDGALGLFYPAFQLYAKIDTVYADINNPMGWAMSTLTLLENIIVGFAMFYLYPRDCKKNPNQTKKYLQFSDILTLCALSAQFNKTLFYFLIDIYGGFAHIKHNPISDLVPMYILPNSIWFFTPIFIVVKYYLPKIRNTIALYSNAVKAE